MYQLSIVMLRSKSKLRTQYPLPPISMLGSNRACQLAKLIPGTRPVFNVILKAHDNSTLNWG